MSQRVAIEALPEWLLAACDGAAGDVALLAGHFAIFTAGGAASDLLDAGGEVPAGAAEMLAFTRLTWELGCEAAARSRDAVRLVVLVDDIQFVRPTLSDRGRAEHLAAALAADYLARTPTLPPYHRDRLAAGGVDERVVHRHRDDRWLLSERELRQAAVRHVRAQLAAGEGAERGVVASDDGSQLTVSLPEQGEFCLVHSGHTGCAGGYAELLSTLYQRGVRRLVAMVPMRCQTQVTVGTELARQLFGLPGMSVVSVAIADPAIGGAAVIA